MNTDPPKLYQEKNGLLWGLLSPFPGWCPYSTIDLPVDGEPANQALGKLRTSVKDITWMWRGNMITLPKLLLRSWRAAPRRLELGREKRRIVERGAR